MAFGEATRGANIVRRAIEKTSKHSVKLSWIAIGIAILSLAVAIFK